MRLLPLLLLAACGIDSVGESSGSLEVVDPETGEGRTLRFDGGALTYQDDEGRHLVLTTWGLNFHCDLAAVHFAGQAGRDIDRRQPHHDLFWSDFAPDRIVVMEQRENIFGGASSGDFYELEATVSFFDEALTNGAIVTGTGELQFAAEDCGTF